MASRRQRGWAVPGFGLPLQWPRTRSLENKPHPIGDEDILLRSCLDNSSDPAYCYTVRELTVLKWINELTDMTDWESRVFDPDFTFEWKSSKILTGYDVTRAMADWCVEEVKYYTHSDNGTAITPALDGGVVKSDSCVGAATRTELQEAAAAIRRSHSSHTAQTDLVDPCLFPLAWERTRLLRGSSISPRDCIARCGEGHPAAMPPEDDCKEPDHGRYRSDVAYSRRFQWLPFDVGFVDDGRGRSRSGSTMTEESICRIKSYINNVHPLRHSQLYHIIEQFIDVVIPLFNRSIINLKAPGYQNQRLHLVDFGRRPFIDRNLGSFRPPEQRACDQYLNDEGQYQDFMFVDLKREFWNVGLQMVLHLHDTDITPENPKFLGEQWHVQGQTVQPLGVDSTVIGKNERICASATYVYSTSNLSSTSPPQLSFRCPVFTEEANAAKGSIFTPPFLPEIYGAKHGDPAIQTLGNVTLREGRVIAWPNTFQTQLLPFSLDDQSRPGHCRALTLHLIDPNRRIMSTSMVPCQRGDWWAHAIRSSVPVFWRLPTELFNKIIDSLDQYPISMEEGLRIRDDFRSERQQFRDRHTQAMEEYEQWDFYGEPGAGQSDDE
ncbi:MAG: hypothetical protein Q9220_000696 [cf. Caloplaca sp. 1 TL-2023]